jgi:predicted MFS family arabinose efflux permease
MGSIVSAKNIKHPFSFAPKFIPWIVWGCAGFFYFYQFIFRVSPNSITDNLMTDLGISACAVGSMISLYYWGYTAMQIPVGIIIDRIGIRAPLSLAILFCSLGSLIFATSESIFVMSIGRIMVGAGSAFAFLSCIKTGSLWFPPSKLGMIIGLSMVMGTAGAASAGFPFAMLLEATDWRTALSIISYIGVGLAVMTWLLSRDRNKNPYRIEPAKVIETEPVLKSFINILKNPQTYIIGLYGGLMYVPLSGFADLWGPPYVMQALGVDKTTASGIVSIMYIGIGVGAPLCAWFADFIQSHKKVLIGCAVLLTLCFTGILYGPTFSISTYYVLYFLAGVFGGGQFLAFAVVCLINPPQRSGMASSVQNMINMTSGIIAQPLIGKLLDLAWDGLMSETGVRIYTHNDYLQAFMSIPISLVVSIILAYMIKETYPRKS